MWKLPSVIQCTPYFRTRLVYRRKQWQGWNGGTHFRFATPSILFLINIRLLRRYRTAVNNPKLKTSSLKTKNLGNKNHSLMPCLPSAIQKHLSQPACTRNTWQAVRLKDYSCRSITVTRDVRRNSAPATGSQFCIVLNKCVVLKNHCCAGCIQTYCVTPKRRCISTILYVPFSELSSPTQRPPD